MSRRLLALGLSCTLAVVGVVIAAPAALAGGGGCAERPSAARGDDVSIGSFCIRPTVLHAKVGDTITWRNRDDFKHVINGANLRWGTFGLRADRSFRQTFDEPGVYPYSCYLHPGMNGAVVVGKVKKPKAVTLGPTRPSAGAAGPASEPAGIRTSEPAGIRDSASGLALMTLVVVLGASSLYAFFRVASRIRRRHPSSPASG